MSCSPVKKRQFVAENNSEESAIQDSKKIDDKKEVCPMDKLNLMFSQIADGTRIQNNILTYIRGKEQSFSLNNELNHCYCPNLKIEPLDPITIKNENVLKIDENRCALIVNISLPPVIVSFDYSETPAPNLILSFKILYQSSSGSVNSLVSEDNSIFNKPIKLFAIDPKTQNSVIPSVKE